MFISYSSVDRTFALRLANDLRSRGFDLWLDKLDIHAGEAWDEAVEKALAGSSAVLLVLSTDAVRSKPVMDEMSYALDEQKIILPILLTPCQVPLRLRRLHYVDFTTSYEQGFALLLSNLHNRLLPTRGNHVRPDTLPNSNTETIIIACLPPMRIPPDELVDLNDLAGLIPVAQTPANGVLALRSAGVGCVAALLAGVIAVLSDASAQASFSAAAVAGGAIFILGLFSAR